MSELLERLTIEHVPPGFTPGGFDCEEPEVNAYLCDGSAARDEADGMTRTYIVKDGAELVGYVAILCDAIRLNKAERPTHHQGAAALKVGAMGVDKKYRKQKVGSWILDRVVAIARHLGDTAGIRFVTLDSLPKDTLLAWYEKYGFKKNLEEDRVRKVLKRAGSRKYKKVRWEDVPLQQISMRYDIRLEGEVRQATAAAEKPPLSE